MRKAFCVVGVWCKEFSRRNNSDEKWERKHSEDRYSHYLSIAQKARKPVGRSQ